MAPSSPPVGGPRVRRVPAAAGRGGAAPWPLRRPGAARRDSAPPVRRMRDPRRPRRSSHACRAAVAGGATGSPPLVPIHHPQHLAAMRRYDLQPVVDRVLASHLVVSILIG